MTNEPRLVKIDQRAIIINQDDKVLLVREQDQDWDLPGGLMTESNNWREALEGLVAELLEMQVVANNPVYATDFVDPESGEYTMVQYVQASAFVDEFDQKEFTEAAWFDIKDINALRFATFETKDAIVAYIDTLN